MTAPRRDRLGDFRIEQELGRGGFGVVYRAVDTRTGRHVALKVYHAAFGVDREGRARLEREARCASQVSHPNVLPVHRLGEIEGVPYLAMELVDGGSLDAVVALLRPLPLARIRRSTFLAAVRAHLDGRPALPPEALDTGRHGDDSTHAEAAAWLALQAAEALEAAHQAGILHRDLKPANLLLRRDGHLYVSDFGLAKDETLATLTRSGEFRGTPHYMSPEQLLADRRTVDARSDVYSLGATLYELLTLQPPFAAGGGAGTELVRAVAFQTPARVDRRNPSVPRDLTVIVHRCLEKDPARRYPTMAALAADLRAFVEHRAIAARPLAWLPRTLDRIRRRPLRAAAGFAAAAVIGGLGWTLGGDAIAARAARRVEVERSRAAATTQQATVRFLLGEGRLLEAASPLAVLQDLAPDDAATAELAAALRAAAEQRLAAAVAAVVERWLPGDPDDLAASWRAAAALLERVPGLAAAAAANPDLAAGLQAAAARIRSIETLVAAQPRARDLFAAADDRVLRALEGLWRQFTSDPVVLRAGAGQRSEALRAGVDHEPLGWPGAERAMPQPGFAAGRLLFAGYGVDSAAPPFRDLDGTDAHGRVLLCFRQVPGHGTEDGPFGPTPASGRHPALFAAKAQFAAARGARALLIVNRRQNGDEFASFPPRSYPLPVHMVSRRVAAGWLAAAGVDMDEIQDRIDGSLSPEVIELPIEIAGASDVPAVGELAEVLERLLERSAPSLAAGARRSQAVAKGALDVCLRLPDGVALPILRRVLAAAPEPRWVELQAAIASQLLQRPRPELQDAVTAALDRAADNRDHVSLHRPFSNYSSDALDDWFGQFERRAGCPHPQPVAELWSPPLADWLLAALWQMDRDAARAAAQTLVDRKSALAAQILGFAGHPADLDRLAAATRDGPTAAPAYGASEWMLAAADALSAWRHPAGLEATVRILGIEARSSYHHNIDDLAACLDRYGDVPEGADELLEAAMLADLRRDVRQAVQRLLTATARWPQVEQRALERLADPTTQATVRLLAALRWNPGRPPLGSALGAAVDRLRRHQDPRLRARACMILPPRDAGGEVLGLLAADTSLREVAAAWVHEMSPWLIADASAVDADRAAVLQIAAEVSDANVLNTLAWGMVRVPGSHASLLGAALRLAQRAVEQAPSDAILNTLGLTEVRCGRFDAARETIGRAMAARAVAGAGESAEDHAVLALACWFAGDRDAARRHAARVEQLTAAAASEDERALRDEVRAVVAGS